MIIEQIDKQRLMIMLEDRDMNSLDLTYENISWKNYKFKVIVAKLLAIAKFKTGFSVEDCKLSIETIPQGSGCMIIFTLFPELKIESDVEDNNLEVRPKNSKPYIYKFKSSNDVLDVYNKLGQMDHSDIQFSAIFQKEDQYFILLYAKGETFPSSISVVLSEYGQEIEFNPVTEAYLYESCKVIHNGKLFNIPKEYRV